MLRLCHLSLRLPYWVISVGSMRPVPCLPKWKNETRASRPIRSGTQPACMGDTQGRIGSSKVCIRPGLRTRRRLTSSRKPRTAAWSRVSDGLPRFNVGMADCCFIEDIRALTLGKTGLVDLGHSKPDSPFRVPERPESATNGHWWPTKSPRLNGW